MRRLLADFVGIIEQNGQFDRVNMPISVATRSGTLPNMRHASVGMIQLVVDRKCAKLVRKSRFRDELIYAILNSFDLMTGLSGTA